MRILQIALFQNNVFYNIDLNQRLPSHSAEAHKMFLKGPVRGAAKSHFHETDHLTSLSFVAQHFLDLFFFSFKHSHFSSTGRNRHAAQGRE